MRRRDVLAGAVAGLAAPAFPALAAPARRSRPGDPAWPDEAAWRSLDKAVGGRLIRPSPVASTCAADPAGAACAALKADLRNPYYLGDQPGGTEVSGWRNAWSPALSARVVAANSASDVAAAVNFARARNLRLVVKGGGHSYQGGSNAPDSLLVWTRAMNAIEVHEAFTPTGAAGPGVPAVSLGAGAMWIDAYDAVTTKAGRYVQGGGCTTVGVAGLVLGGGFGSFSKRYGPACASLVEAEIVTADGVVRTVNAQSEPELFWALKGGGQSAFGVVTRLTLQTHDLVDIAGGLSMEFAAESDDAYRRLLGAFVDLCADALVSPHWGESVHLHPNNRLEVSMVFADLTADQAKAAWSPLVRLAQAPDSGVRLANSRALAIPMRRFWDFGALRKRGSPLVVFDDRPGAPADHAWWAGDAGQVSAFIHGYDSLWLPASLLAAGERRRLVDALFKASRLFPFELHFNKGLAGAPGEVLAAARSTPMNPAALDAFALAIVAAAGPPAYPGFPSPNAEQARAEARRIAQATAALRDVAPAGASYVSESNYFNADWRRAFWGANYPRLSALKAKWDPAGVFFLRHGPGSEHWSEDGFTRTA